MQRILKSTVMNGMSNAEIVLLLGERFRQYRLQCRLTQEEVSVQTGISVFTIRKFETGKAVNLSLQTLLALLRVVGQIEEVDKLLPPLPPNPEQTYKQTTQVKRIRHGR